MIARRGSAFYACGVVAAAEQSWPSLLWLIRHGESAGNVARDAAEAAGTPVIDIAHRDVDVPLSPLGERQSVSLGHWFGEQPESRKPTVILTSPYVRALQTTELLVQAAKLTDAPIHRFVDERLREKEFGVLNRLTKAGIIAQYPREAELRAHIGKFYYRPPGGESWCDVILRLRSVMDHIQLQYAGERVLIVAHQVVVLCLRYLLEHMTEHAILRIDAEKDVANCAVTAYECVRDESGRVGMALRLYNHVTPLLEEGTAVTTEPDARVAPR